MEIYKVGGAVRDKLLGLPVRDVDWVVVGAREDEMLEKGFRQVGKDFPVFLHPKSGEEYALARTESKSGHGYTGFAVNADTSVTLEQDLKRRDLTVNAIAQDKDGNLVDPFNGQHDIKDRILRHVSPAFSEDPLRVLRVAKFAARYHHLGFTIAAETTSLMQDMVSAGELEHLVSERVWLEVEGALKEKNPVVFFRTLRECGALAVILPEVDALFGIPQPPQYHPEIDTGVHTLMCLEQATELSDDPVVRYAILVHDVGKGLTPAANWPHHYKHETLGLGLLDSIAQRLKVPRRYKELARLVCEYHTIMHRILELRSVTILRLLEALDAFRRPRRMHRFMLACEADARGRTGQENQDYPQRDRLLAAYEAASNLDLAGLLEQREIKGKYSHGIREFVKEQRLAAIQQALGKTS